jgi:hypothetical protein
MIVTLGKKFRREKKHEACDAPEHDSVAVAQHAAHRQRHVNGNTGGNDALAQRNNVHHRVALLLAMISAAKATTTQTTAHLR